MGDNSAEVAGGYYEGNLSASGNTYYVVRKDGKRVVDSGRDALDKSCAKSGR